MWCLPRDADPEAERGNAHVVFLQPDGLCITGVSLDGGSGAGLRQHVEIWLVLDGKRGRIVDVAWRVGLGEHTNGHAHIILIEFLEEFLLSIGRLHNDWQLLNRVDDLVHLSGKLRCRN